MAPRVLLTAPRFSSMSVELRTAHAANERSANAPSTLSSLKSQHGSGCMCCSGLASKKSRKTARGKNGAKCFPGARPWMISH